MTESIPLYPDNPVRREYLNRQLVGIYGGLPGSVDDEELLTTRTAQTGDWEIRLSGLPKAELLMATAIRMGTEFYTFFRVDDLEWLAPAGMTSFPEAHFYSLVRMAIQPDLEWTVTAPSD